MVVEKDPAPPLGGGSRLIIRVRQCLGWETAYNMAAQSGSRVAFRWIAPCPRAAVALSPDLMRTLLVLIGGIPPSENEVSTIHD